MSDWQNTIQTGDCFDVLGELPESSVHMCMTSPPYYGLRDYGVDGQIGLEETLDEYIDRLVCVGDSLRRVLRDDGSWWLNLGDTYAGSGRNNDEKTDGEVDGDGHGRGHIAADSFVQKDKMLVPHRVAIALQSDGWVVRNDVDWLKPNPMPSSVKDRLNTTTEQIFHLTPQPDYWYDLDAIREPYADKSVRAAENGHAVAGQKRAREDAPGNHLENDLHGRSREEQMHPVGKNPGDVFEVSTKPFPEAHFAVYPSERCEKPIKAACPPKVCGECGSPYEREVEIERSPGSSPGKGDGDVPIDAQVDGGHQRDGHDYTRTHISAVKTKGWTKSCDCDTDATEPGTCLDPFAGAGTTLLKAKELGRRFVGIELNPEYADMARARVGLTPEDPARVRDDDAQEGLEAFTDGGGSDA